MLADRVTSFLHARIAAVMLDRIHAASTDPCEHDDMIEILPVVSSRSAVRR
jgi:hypothetical protein